MTKQQRQKAVRIDPALAAGFIAIAETVNQPPEVFFSFITEIVRRHHGKAKRLRSTNGDGRLIYFLVEGLVTIMFTDELDAWVIRGVGTIPDSTEEPVVVISLDSESEGVH